MARKQDPIDRQDSRLQQDPRLHRQESQRRPGRLSSPETTQRSQGLHLHLGHGERRNRLRVVQVRFRPVSGKQKVGDHLWHSDRDKSRAGSLSGLRLRRRCRRSRPTSVSQMHSSGNGHRAQELGTVSANVEQLEVINY